MKNAPHKSASACQRRGSRTAGATRPAGTDDSIVNLPGRFHLPRHDPARGWPGGWVMQTRRGGEAGRPRAAKFAPWGVSIPGGRATGCGRKARRMLTADLLARARAGDGEAFRELTEPHRRELQ